MGSTEPSWSMADQRGSKDADSQATRRRGGVSTKWPGMGFGNGSIMLSAEH